MKKVKFALVGCGNIGPRHLDVITAEKRAQLVAVCDSDLLKCKKYSALYHIPYYTDYNTMLSETDADIISICTPHHLHEPMAILAARHHKHILVEKPMALTLSECRNMTDEAKKNNIKLYVVKQNRFNAPVTITKSALEKKSLGKIFMVKCDVLWNRGNRYYEESDWRGKKECEGGALFTQASHFIDLLVWWFGNVSAATTFIDTKNHNIEVEDCGSSVLTFDSGTIASLNWTTCVYEKNYEGSITIIAEKGTVKIGGAYLNKLDYWNVPDYPLPADVKFEDQPNRYLHYQGSSSNHDKVIAAVVADLLHEQASIVEGFEGMKSIMAIEKIYSGIQ